MATPITVKVDAAVEGLKPVSDTAKFEVGAVCHTQVDVPADKKAVEVPVQPPIEGPPTFLLIRPLFPDASKISFDGNVEYSTAKHDASSGQRKPLRGTHVFINGMPEWVADMLAPGGKPGPLERLFFWNNLEGTEPDGSSTKKKGTEDVLKVTIQIIVGYEPKAPKPKS